MRIITIILFSLFAFSSCKKDDPVDLCEGVTCINGGICINGECDCPTGYEGPDCGRQKAPSTILLFDIKVLKFPSTDENGAGWDLTSGADIYPTFSKDGVKIYGPNGANDNYRNADPTKEHKFTFGNNAPMTELNDFYDLNLFDYDELSQNDFMGSVSFKPYSSTNGFPKRIILGAGTDLIFDVGLRYEFK